MRVRSDSVVISTLLILVLSVCCLFVIKNYKEYATISEPYYVSKSPLVGEVVVAGEELVEVYKDEFVVYAEGPWCPVRYVGGKITPPLTPCPIGGYPAGVYVLNGEGELVEERQEPHYIPLKELEKGCNDKFGLPESYICQQNMPVYAQDFNDSKLSRQWAYSKYKKLFPALTPIGVKVAVFDTGVSTHPDLNVITGKTFVQGVQNTTDRNGHGTHVAGSCCAINGNDTGVASPGNGVKVIPIKVLNDNGSGSLSAILKGVDWLISYSKRNVTDKIVANMSLGAYGATSLCRGMKKLRKAGIVPVVAAGNDGKSLNTYKSYPAACADEDAIVVGSVTRNNSRSNFSNYGDLVDVYGPGSVILSTSKDGGYEVMSGTSMATPFVAGVVANVLSCGDPRGNIESILAENMVQE